ncbi:MAG: hypothetical protein HQ557_08550 [Bacteroidetes bacterium]|nr:hypothetical protein [Bacteroidota bacterium]
MTPFKSSSKIKIINQEAVAITASSHRRVMYGGICLLLLATAIVSFNLEQDFQGNRLIGTVLILFFIAGSAVAAGFNKVILFDKENDLFVRKIYLFSLLVSREYLLSTLSEIVCLQYTDLEFMRSGRKEIHAGRSRINPMSFFQNRSHLYRLYVETSEQKILLQESTFTDDLENTIQVLTLFLGVGVKRSTTH